MGWSPPYLTAHTKAVHTIPPREKTSVDLFVFYFVYNLPIAGSNECLLECAPRGLADAPSLAGLGALAPNILGVLRLTRLEREVICGDYAVVALLTRTASVADDVL